MLSENKIDKQIINQEDEYIWCDFLLEFRKVFDSFESLVELFVERFPRIGGKIEYEGGYFLKKDTQTDLHSRVLSFPKTKIKFKNTTFVKGKMKEEILDIEISKLFIEAQDNFPVYCKETFKPCDHQLGRFEFNTWTGFKADVTDFRLDMNYVTPILEFIQTVIMNNNESSFQYFISWLRHIAVKPYRKTEVAVFLHSDAKGTGKGSLGYWLKNYVFGSHVSNVVCGLSKLVQKHNTCIQRKIFTMVDEMPQTQGEFHSQFDSMKHLITDPEITIEPKGVNPYEIPNMANFLMMSNNVMALKIERGDRRYACFEVSDSKKGDEDFWDNIHENILTEETAKHFFQYLKQIDDKDCVSLRKIPETKLRQRMMSNSTPTHERFFTDIEQDDNEIPVNAYMDEFKHKDITITKGLRSDTLYHLYDNYCTRGKEVCIKRRLFFDLIKDKSVDQFKTKINGKSTIYYLLR
jgi:hypothetical protein